MQHTSEGNGFSDDLPIFQAREDILSAVDNHQVTIITAETGAGKSTQVPQYLANHGYQKVIVTQPRILAARNLCNRVRNEWSQRTQTDAVISIGYRTAHERDDSPDTLILYCTDGLQLVREITGSGATSGQVLVLDEVHEWNENMEVLVAWAKRRCEEDPHFKVVIMSATIEADKLAAYFGTDTVITVAGRSHEVTKRRGEDIVSEIQKQLEAGGRNILVFLPGKAEIESVSTRIKTEATALGVPVIPLHGQLESVSQQLAFDSYPQGKLILATNIAQTSVTIDDIDVVIDSGLERRSEVQNGVEGLFIAQTSQADCLQRAGRAGRTKQGVYVLAPLDDMPCIPFEERSPYGIPEILRKHIDRLALRLANVGIDIELLDFYHEPSHRAIKNAKQTLKSLGAMMPDGKVTPVGRQMEQFPVESSFARMLVEAGNYSASIRLKLAAIIGIQEVGGIVKGGTRFTGWRRFTRQTRSDLLGQYEVYIALPTISVLEYDELGIIGKNVSKARDVMERIEYDLKLNPKALDPIEAIEEEPLMKCIVAGEIDQLWAVDENGDMTHIGTDKKRELSSSTVVSHPKLVVGTPFDLQITTHKGDLETLHLVQGITAVNPTWLESLAPHLFTLQRGKVYFDSVQGVLAVRQLLKFNNKSYEGASTLISDPTPANRRLFSDLYAAWLYEQIERERRHLQNGHKRRIPAVPLRQLQQQVRSIAGDVITVQGLSSERQGQLKDLGKLQTHLGSAFMAQLGTSRREDSRTAGGHHHRSWQPQHKRKYHQ